MKKFELKQKNKNNNTISRSSPLFSSRNSRPVLYYLHKFRFFLKKSKKNKEKKSNLNENFRLFCVNWSRKSRNWTSSYTRQKICELIRTDSNSMARVSSIAFVLVRRKLILSIYYFLWITTMYSLLLKQIMTFPITVEFAYTQNFTVEIPYFELIELQFMRGLFSLFWFSHKR